MWKTQNIQQIAVKGNLLDGYPYCVVVAVDG